MHAVRNAGVVAIMAAAVMAVVVPGDTWIMSESMEGIGEKRAAKPVDILPTASDAIDPVTREVDDRCQFLGR